MAKRLSRENSAAAELLKPTVVVGFATLLSRISGLARDVVFAHIIGSSAAADVFFIAFRIPNFLRRIFAEGAFSMAFIPVYAEFLNKHPEEQTRAFLSLMIGRLGLVLLLLSGLGIVFAEWIILVLAPGYAIEPSGKFDNTVMALQICFPYLFFISLVALCAGVLNSLGHFSMPAATPILLNLVLISTAIWALPYYSQASTGLAAGVILAGALQLLVQLPWMWRYRMLPLPRLFLAGDGALLAKEGARKVYRLMLPVIFGTSIIQINILINTILASFLVTGSISWLYYSDRVMEFPLGIFGIALATVLMPRLSAQFASDNTDGFSATLDLSLRLSLLIGLPACIGLIMLAEPVIVTLFYYGAFNQMDVSGSTASLIAYSIGLPAFLVIKILAPGFYARQDTRTPVRIGIITVIINITLSLLLVGTLAHVGLALATSLAAITNAILLWWKLRNSQIYQPDIGWLLFLVKLILAVLGMGMFIYGIGGGMVDWLDWNLAQRVTRLVLLLVGAILFYFLLLWLQGVKARTFLTLKHQ